jgi:NitT/TauT family transport system ATP-binding protein
VTIKLEARDIGLSYFQPRSDSRLVALEAVSLTIHEGEFVSVVGPSGCGKTTFLSIVDGLLRPTSGQIIVDGRLVTTPGPDRAVVFQDASLLPWRTVLGNVSYGLECQRRTGREARERAADAAAALIAVAAVRAARANGAL